MKTEFTLGCWQISLSEGTVASSEETKHIEPKALSVLLELARADGQVVSREKLFSEVWPNQIVGEDVLNSSIATLRKALQDDRKTNKYIQTIPKKGYKLVKDVHWTETVQKQQQHTPKKLTNIWPILLAFTAMAIVALVYFFIQKPSPETPAVDDYSIAVLPFDVYSSDPELKYFADGMVEEMLHQLAASPKLKVIARSASFRYKNSDKELSTIASELNVKYLIEGSVRAHNDELRISVQLFDARNNFQLWSRVFDDKTGDLFRIQQQVGTAVNHMLDIGGEDETIATIRSHPDSDQAYKYFIMAQAHYKNAGVHSYNQAIELLDKAIKLAPNYALAHTSKAIGHLLRFQYNGEDLHKAAKIASAELDKALQIEPLQPEAYAAKGLMYTYLQDYEKAESAFLKAIELNPKLRLAQHNFGYMLWRQARFQEALVHLGVALASDPLAKPTNFLMGDSLASLAEFDKAIAHYQHCQQVLPGYVWCYSGLARIYQVVGNLELAKINMEKSRQVEDTGDSWRDISHSGLLIHLGQYQQATKMLDNIENNEITGNRLFRNRLLIAKAQGDDAGFINYMDMKYQQFPSNQATKKFRAYTAFMQKDYSLAVKLYQAVMQENKNSIFNIWDYADGISHGINLAVSYQKIGKLKQREIILMQLEQHLSSFSGRLDNISGVIYIQSKYQSLIGNTSKSQNLLEQVQHKWALKWWLESDSFWDELP